MLTKLRAHAPALIAAVVVGGSLASLLPASKVLPAFAASPDDRAKGLAACQDTIDKESAKQLAKDTQSYQKCIRAVRKDRLATNTAAVSNSTAATCAKELRKVRDTRSGGKSNGAKARDKILKACDPATTPDLPFTEADVLQPMVAMAEALGGSNLSATCAAATGINVTSVKNLTYCISNATTQVAQAAVATAAPKAPSSLAAAAAAIPASAPPPPPSDPSANDDAAQAAIEVVDRVDADGDGAANPPLTFNPRARIAFVTSATTTGAFSGSGNANDICETASDAAGLPGNFLAWVSDSVNPAAPDQLGTRTRKWSIPYVTVTGRVVANQLTDFLNGAIVSPIDVDENGATVVDAPVWTGTLATNDNALPNCLAFDSALAAQSGVIGRTSLSDSGWSNAGTQTCDQQARLYCIQVDD